MPYNQASSSCQYHYHYVCCSTDLLIKHSPYCPALPSLVFMCVMTWDVKSSNNKAVTPFNCLSKNMLCVGFLSLCVCVWIAFLLLRSGAFLHSAIRCNVLKIMLCELECKLSVCLRVKGHTFKLENHFSPLFFLKLKQAPSLPTHTHTRSCPRVLSRLQPAPGEPVHGDTPCLHQPLTRIALSLGSRASFFYCSIQTESRTLRYFLLYVLWISLHDTIEEPSVWYQSLVYTWFWSWKVCVEGLWMGTWEHMQD